MSEPDDPVDRKHLRVTGRHKAVTSPNISVSEVTAAVGDPTDNVVIVITQAYGPRGDNLVGLSDVTFDGHPAVTLKLRAAGREGLIHLSPIHGDSRKQGFTDIAPGTRCELICPVSGQPLDYVSDVDDGSGARYFAIYLTDQLSHGSMVMVSDVWGHYHSRIIDDFELLSDWAASQPG
jgi:hypothetical protein